MLPGKVPPEVLEQVVFKFLGRPDPNVLLGPALGQDASLIRIGDNVIVVSTDPITGSVEDIGWLAVNINANDIATFGVSPRWFLVSIMLPPGCHSSDLERIMVQMHEAANSLGISIVGGHSEVTESLTRPIVVGFMMGLTKNGQYVTSAGAQPGDAIILTKSIGIEGTAILATEGKLFLENHIDRRLLEEAQTLRSQISVVREGVTAFQTGFVTAMHDPTEGGISGGIHEICDASGVGFLLHKNSIPIHPATKKICEVLSIDPLSLISSGCMLITCQSGHEYEIIQSLEEVGVPATMVGRILANPARREITNESGTYPLNRPQTDELWSALRRITSQETS